MLYHDALKMKLQAKQSSSLTRTADSFRPGHDYSESRVRAGRHRAGMQLDRTNEVARIVLSPASDELVCRLTYNDDVARQRPGQLAVFQGDEHIQIDT
jgi:hypothetical protein